MLDWCWHVTSGVSSKVKFRLNSFTQVDIDLQIYGIPVDLQESLCSSTYLWEYAKFLQICEVFIKSRRFAGKVSENKA